MYGLAGPNSDFDYTHIFHDSNDYLSPFPSLESSSESKKDGNDVKVYSLQFFLGLVIAGNPNAIELLPFAADSKYSTISPPLDKDCLFLADTIFRVEQYIYSHGLDSRLISAYYGHLHGILKEINTKGITPKRLSHALRVMYSAHYAIEYNTIPVFANMGKELEISRSVKFAPEDEFKEMVPYYQKVIEEGLKYIEKTLDQTQKSANYKVKFKEYINHIFLTEYQS